MKTLVLLITLWQLYGTPEIGTLAYATKPDTWHNVCLNRVRNGWNPLLNCDHPCLVSAIEQEDIGQTWLISLPNCRHYKRFYVACHTVDVGSMSDLPELRERNEVVEISHDLARFCGYKDYVDRVYVWRLK